MNSVVFPGLSILSALLVSAFLMVYLAKIATHVGLTDEPSYRKHHKHSIPVIGGVAMILAFLLSLMLLPGTLSGYRYLFFGVGILGIIGVLDDHSEISSVAKFTAQILVASLIVILEDSSIRNIGDIFSTGVPQGLGFLAPALTILGIVGIINAFNMIDGLDGLAGSLALVALIVLAYIFFISGDYDSYHLLLVCSTVVTVFLFFNIPRTIPDKLQIFMGDTGSMFLGLIIAYFLIKATLIPGPSQIAAPIAPWFVAVPLLDMLTVIYIRLAQQRSPFRADRIHIHHVLTELSFSPLQTLLLVVAPAIALALVGFLAITYAWPDWVLFWSFLVLIPLSIGTKAILFRSSYKTCSENQSK